MNGGWGTRDNTQSETMIIGTQGNDAGGERKEG